VAEQKAGADTTNSYDLSGSDSCTFSKYPRIAPEDCPCLIADSLLIFLNKNLTLSSTCRTSRHLWPGLDQLAAEVISINGLRFVRKVSERILGTIRQHARH